MPLPLLQTKLYIPPPRQHLVSRPTITAKLRAGLLHPLTLIAAPAGFGKTTLVSEWIAQTAAAVAWLSLDDDDNEPPRFPTYLMAALQTQQPEMGAAAQGLLTAPQAPPLLIFPIRVFFSGPFGEELGWRGFALPRLQAKFAPLTATLILGVMGAIWHVPLTFIGQNQWPDLLLILAGYLLMSWIYNGTNGSVLLALLFHGVTTTIGGAFLHRMYSRADAVQFSIWHTVGWYAVALLVLVATRANLGCKPVAEVKNAPVGQSLAVG